MPDPRVNTYKPIWDELKKSQVVTLELQSPVYVNRVQKAISKCKHGDYGFKIINEIERYVLKFSKQEVNGKCELTIRLVSRLNIADIIR